MSMSKNAVISQRGEGIKDGQRAGCARRGPLDLRTPLGGPAMKEIGARLTADGLVAIREAFQPAFAERMYRSLDACTAWRVYEKYETHFHFRHHNLYQGGEYPPDLAKCGQVFDSAATKAWVTRLSGRPCTGPTVFSASWYLPGDHSLPHTDAIEGHADNNRQVAFVWHLAKDWRSEWGGAFFWCPKSVYLPPVFNTLLLFNVADTRHFVTQVSPYAQGKRLTINGWWTGPATTGEPVRPAPDRFDDGEVLIEFY
jgi:hypothetical protein